MKTKLILGKSVNAKLGMLIHGFVWKVVFNTLNKNIHKIDYVSFNDLEEISTLIYITINNTINND